MRLQDVMTTGVERIAPSDSIQRARTLMAVKGVHHLVVFDEHRVQGIVAAEDLDRAERQAATAVADVMSHPVVTGSPRMTIRQAANLMRGRALGALPVVDRGKLAGIVTVSDLLALLGRGVERPAKARRPVLRHRGMKPRSAAGVW